MLPLSEARSVGGEGMKSFYGDFDKSGNYNAGIVGTRLLKLVKALDPEAAKIEPHELSQARITAVERGRGYGNRLSSRHVSGGGSAFPSFPCRRASLAVYYQPPAKGNPMARKAKLGSGKRFAAVSRSAARSGARDPDAVAAAIGRKKYGASHMAKMAAKGKKRGK